MRILRTVATSGEWPALGNGEPMLPIVDTDTHLAEPPDLWTNRVSKKWADVVPRVVRDEKRNFDRWVIGDRKLTGVASWATAGWPEYPPSFPPTQDEAF